ncbi:MAG TPA: VWA domain-containing protein, partial [Candidatus Hydrogenedentes bacterium]|nr:VWA domain-containing protein [Candidatus Hydrogenedentota bacterium]
SIAFAVAFLTGGRTEKMPASESFQLSKGAESPKGVNLENLRDGRSIRELRSIPSNETNTKQLPATTTDGAAAQNWAEISESNALAQQGKPEEPGPIALQIQADPSIAEQIPHGVNEVTRFKTVDNPNTVTEETTALGIVVESEHGRPFLRQSREGVVDFFYDSQRPGEEHHWDTVPQGRLGDFYDLDFGRNNYAQMTENAFLQVAREPLSTFGLDVDTASYANVRRFLTSAQIPPPDAVRIEEFVNAFAYEYAAPSDGHSVAVSAEIAGCPWKAQHRLARIAVKAKDIPFEAQPPLRLTFLIDVSGSMENAKKLPLLKESMLALAKKLRATDQLAIVTYSDSARTVLRPTPANHIEIIHDVIDGLSANGSTNGAGGIELAYNAAKEQFLENGLNRVVLASDGDFNVGETDNAALEQRIQDYAKSGVFLTVLGFGVDNLQDDRLEMLANKGNGNYFYIDSFAEANRVLVERMAGTIAVAAKDAKIQVEFNPAKVGAYRLLGYENRALTAPDFNNDAKDAGDIGAGQTVTALYEILPVGVSLAGPGIDALKYQTPPPAPVNDNPEMMTVKLRYKEPTATESKRIELPVVDGGATVDSLSGDFRMAASAAAFAMLLRNSQYKGTADFDLVQRLAESAKGNAADRAEFVSLVVAAKTLAK